MISVTLDDQRVSMTVNAQLQNKATVTDLRNILSNSAAVVVRGGAQLADTDTLNDGDVLTLKAAQ